MAKTHGWNQWGWSDHHWNHQVLDDLLLVVIHFPAISRCYRGALELFQRLSSPCCILDGDLMFFFVGSTCLPHQDWVVFPVVSMQNTPASIHWVDSPDFFFMVASSYLTPKRGQNEQSFGWCFPFSWIISLIWKENLPKSRQVHKDVECLRKFHGAKLGECLLNIPLDGLQLKRKDPCLKGNSFFQSIIV